MKRQLDVLHRRLAESTCLVGDAYTNTKTQDKVTPAGWRATAAGAEARQWQGPGRGHGASPTKAIPSEVGDRKGRRRQSPKS